jgi:hypothetical protein
MEIFNLYKSNKPDKKFMVQFVNPNTDRWNTIHIGSAGMSDYTIHNDDNRKNRYIQRHSGMNEDWTKNGIYTAGFWSHWLLWNKKTIIASIKNIEKKFKIKINNNPVLNQKHSAYRSMKLSQLGLTKPTTKKNEGELEKWILARWQNLTAKLTDGDKFYNCGNRGKNQKILKLPSVCRPSIRIDNKTPTLANQYTDNQIKKAINIKKQGRRINWRELK